MTSEIVSMFIFLMTPPPFVAIRHRNVAEHPCPPPPSIPYRMDGKSPILKVRYMFFWFLFFLGVHHFFLLRHRKMIGIFIYKYIGCSF